MKHYEKKVALYVNPETGSDENRGSKNSPFATLKKACDTVAYKMAHSAYETAYSIFLSEGDHLVTEPIVFDGKAVKAFDYTLSFSGAKNAVVTSAVKIPAGSFKKVEGKPYYAYTLNLEGENPAFRDLYCNGKLVTLATSGNERVMAFSIPNDQDRNDPKNLVPKLYVAPESVADIDPACPSPLEIWIKVEWQLHAVRIERIDLSDVRKDENGNEHVALYVYPDDWNCFIKGFYSTLRNRYYWGKNQLAYLTEENSFFYDRKSGTIYFYPAPDVDMNTAVISYPTVENLFILNDMKNVSFEDIAFTGTTSNYISENGYVAGQGGRIKKNGIGFLTHAAIYANNINGLSVDRCAFYQLGGDGINTKYLSENISIDSCTFEYIAMSPIRIGSCAANTDHLSNINANIRIVNNYIREPGWFYKSNVAIALGAVRNLKLCYNTILDTPYSAVSIGWTWSRTEKTAGERVNILNAEIAYNRVENFMYGMKDGGALYTLGGNSTLEDHTFYNFMHDNYCVCGATTGQRTGGYTVLYHDGSSSHWLTSSNVIVMLPENPSRFCYISYQSIPRQQVYNITAKDNYVINETDPDMVLGKGFDKNKQKDFFLFAKNNKVGMTMDTLDKKAASIIRNAGAKGYKKIL